MSGKSGGGCECGTHEVCPPALPLAAFEVAVRGRGAALAGLKDVGVHAQAHPTAGTAPFEAGGGEDLVEPFVLRLLLDAGRAGHDERAHGRVNVLAGHDRGRGTQVLDPRVRTGPDEDAVDGDVLDLRAR